MSQENAKAEIIRRFAEAFNARDEAGLMSMWWPSPEDALEAVGLRE